MVLTHKGGIMLDERDQATDVEAPEEEQDDDKEPIIYEPGE